MVTWSDAKLGLFSTESPGHLSAPLTCVGRHRRNLERIELTHADWLLIALRGHFHNLANVWRIGDNLLIFNGAVQVGLSYNFKEEKIVRVSRLHG